MSSAIAFGQRQVSNIYKGLNQYHVVLEVAPEFQQNPDALNSSTFLQSSGKLVPSALSRITSTSNTSLSVNHQGIFPSITLSFNLAPGASIGPAVQHIEEARRQLGVPNTVHATFQGTAQAFKDSLANLFLLLLRGSWARFTSFSEFCTRATFTPSRFSRRFPRPASARCSLSS